MTAPVTDPASSPLGVDTLCRTPECAIPVEDAALVCMSCADKVASTLRAVPELLDDLLVTMTRQDVGAPGVGGGGSDEPPLLYRPEASEAGRDLHAVLDVWVRHLARSRGLSLTDYRPVSRPDIRVAPAGPQRPPIPGQRTFPRPPQADTTTGCLAGARTVELALWLARHLDTLRESEHGGQIVDELLDAVDRARHATDRPGERCYLGPCSCDNPPEQLYARPDAATVTCRSCGERYYVADRRRWMLSQSQRLLVTAEEASRALPALLGVEVTPRLLAELHRRHGLERQGPARSDPHRRFRYRVGDIVDVLTDRAANAQRRGMGRRAARPKDVHVPEELRALFHRAQVAARAQERARRHSAPVQSD